MMNKIQIQRIKPVLYEQFQKQYITPGQPIVITHLVDSWPAMGKWDVSYFIHQFGNIKTGSIPVINGECDFNTTRGSKLSYQTLSETLSAVASGNVQKGQAVATSTDVFPKELSEEYSVPEYCCKGKYLRNRIFIGASGTVTSLHQDLFHNLYTMVKGTKRITLFPPSSPVYPNSRFSKLPNHAKVDPERPDYLKFPLFEQAQSYIIELKAGETLFIPPFWWHHLRNLEESIAVSFWWAQGYTLPIAWAAAQYKKLRGI